MTIPVACAGCHRRYEVDERFAGKTIKCAYCGQPMPIPSCRTSGRCRRRLMANISSVIRTKSHHRRFEPVRSDATTMTRTEPRSGPQETPKTLEAKRRASEETAEGRFSLPVILISLAAVVVVSGACRGIRTRAPDGRSAWP